MQIDCFSDDYKVIGSGSFLLRTPKSSAKIALDMRPEYNYVLEILWTFKDGKPGEDVHVEPGKHDNNHIELIVTNGNGFLGNGTQTAMRVAEFSNGDVLLCNYFFSRPTNDNPRLFTYTLYIEKAGE